MLIGQVFNSISAWQKLSGVNMRPKLALKVLRYTKLVSDEHSHAEKMRTALIYEVSGAKEGEDVKLEPGTPELAAFVEKFNEVLQTESDLQPLDMDLSDVVEAVDEKDESLTVSDLALLEPFFLCDEVTTLAEQAEESTDV